MRSVMKALLIITTIVAINGISMAAPNVDRTVTATVEVSDILEFTLNTYSIDLGTINPTNTVGHGTIPGVITSSGNYQIAKDPATDVKMSYTSTGGTLYQLQSPLDWHTDVGGGAPGNNIPIKAYFNQTYTGNPTPDYGGHYTAIVKFAASSSF